MAANTFLGTISNAWNTAANWSLLAVPTATDGNTATFSALSPACTLTLNVNCNSLDMSAYVDTITFSTYQLQVNTGNITLGAGMTISGSGALRSNSTNTNISITSNGCYVPNLILSGVNAHTITLVDNFTVGRFSAGNSTAVVLTINGNKILVSENWDLGAGQRPMQGTTTIEFTGALDCIWGGTVTQPGNYTNPIIINKSGGTLTLGPFIYLNTGTVLTYTAGTVDAGTSYVTAVATTFNTGSGITFYDLWLAGTTTLNSTLNSISTYIKGVTSLIGTSGLVTSNLEINQNTNAATPAISLKAALTYTVNTYFKAYGSNLLHTSIASGTPATKANLIFNGLVQELINVNATDIDSSGGNKIWSLHGVISNSDNWGVSNSSVVPVTIASVN